MSVDSPLVPALAALVRALESVGHPFMIIGGLAVIARGFPRLTLDVDAVVAGEGLDLDVAMARLAREGIVPRIVDPIRFARERQMLLLRHEPTGTQVDLSLAWLMFEQEALARASIEQFAGVVAPFPTPEDLAPCSPSLPSCWTSPSASWSSTRSWLGFKRAVTGSRRPRVATRSRVNGRWRRRHDGQPWFRRRRLARAVRGLRPLALRSVGGRACDWERAPGGASAWTPPSLVQAGRPNAPSLDRRGC